MVLFRTSRKRDVKDRKETLGATNALAGVLLLDDVKEDACKKNRAYQDGCYYKSGPSTTSALNNAVGDPILCSSIY